jgi:hypothetical protein
MANGGWYGGDREWDLIEAPLKLLDGELNRFAEKYGLTVTKNAKNRPERSLTWGKGIQKLIQVFLSDDASLELKVWICAWQDRDGKRFWKNKTLRDGVQVPELRRDVFELLEDGKSRLDEWAGHPENLELVTKTERPS